MPLQRVVSTGSSSGTTKRARNEKKTSTKKRPPVFPTRLYDMLDNAEQEGYDHIISWMPDGTSFKIHVDGSKDKDDEQALVAVIKQHFNQTRFKSFLRQLQLYGFDRIYKGPQRGECRHEMFVRGRRDLLHKKSIEDFRQQANEESARSPKSAQTMFQTPPARVSDSNISDALPAFVPSCAPIIRCVSEADGKCTYTQKSVIPTKLVNLILPDSDFEIELPDSCVSNRPDSCMSNTKIDNNDEVSLALQFQKNMRASIISDYSDETTDNGDLSEDEVECWRGIELSLLSSAL